MYKILAASITTTSGLVFREGDIVSAHKFEQKHLAGLLESKAIEEYVEPVKEEAKAEPALEAKPKKN